MTQYPAMHSLSMDRLLGAPLLDHLQYLFPALDDTLSFCLTVFHGVFARDNFLAIRAANQHAQESSPVCAWKKLDRLVCDPVLLYALGLRCPIRHVLLHATLKPVHTYALKALCENPVPRLTITLCYPPFPFDGMFSPELTATLTHLTLCVIWDFRGCDLTEAGVEADPLGPPGWRDILGAIASSVKPLHKLTHLRVVVHFLIKDHGIEWTNDDVARRVPHAKAYLRAACGPSFDFDGTAAALVHSLPCLRYIFVATGGSLSALEPEIDLYEEYEWWHLARVWRVSDHALTDEPGLVELHDEVAKTIIRREELFISEPDAAFLHLNLEY